MRRTLIALALCLLLILPALADSSGPNDPGTLADDASNGGNQSWSSASNAAASDNSYATAPCECDKVGLSFVHDTTHYLKANNFGFSVPSDATIDSITVDVERHAGGAPSSIVDSTVSLVVNGTVQGSNQASPLVWPSTDFYAQYGPMLWGLSLTPTNVNASSFGVVIAAVDTAGLGQCPNAGVALIDHIRLTVAYTPAPPAPRAMPRRAIQICSSPGRIESVHWRQAA